MDEQQSETTGYPQDVDRQDVDLQDVHVDVVGEERTGMAAVDAVLDEVATLSERPVSDHVAVFERAHDRLRRALDAQPDA